MSTSLATLRMNTLGSFKSPFHIGDNEVRFGGESSAVDVDLHGHGEVMGRAVQRECAGDLDGGVAGGRDGAVVFLRGEGDFGVVVDVENILVHFLVAAGLAAVSAACRDNDGTGDGVRGAIEVDGSALHVEGSGDVVAVAAESQCDLAGVGIDGEGLMLGEGAGWQKAAS